MQASYRIRERVPVVHLFGRLQQGGTFLVRDHRRTPSFYVAAADAQRAREFGATRQWPTPRRTFAGTRITRIDVQTPPDAPVLRDRLHAQGIDTFEADVRFAVGFLIDHNIRGGLMIDGHAERGEGVDWVFDDPEIAPAEVEVEPSILSFDIETDPSARKLLAISLYGRDIDEVYIVDSSGREMPARAFACNDEASALKAFCQRVAEIDPDIFTGWNVVDFDLRVLSRIAARVRQPLHLGREPGPLRIRPARGYFGSGQASIPGRVVLDGMDLVRGAFGPLRRLFSRFGLAGGLGRGQGRRGRCARSRGRNHPSLPDRPRGIRAIRAHGCASRPRDHRGDAVDPAGARPQPAHRHAA